MLLKGTSFMGTLNSNGRLLSRLLPRRLLCTFLGPLSVYMVILVGAIQLTFFSAQYQAQNLAQVIFGVLRHVYTCSALVLNLAQNVAQFGARCCA